MKISGMDLKSISYRTDKLRFFISEPQIIANLEAVPPIMGKFGGKPLPPSKFEFCVHGSTPIYLSDHNMFSVTYA